MAQHNIINRIKVGDVITARLLNDITYAINANTKAISAPKEVLQKGEVLQSSESSGTIGNEVFDSTSGTETTVTATDSNGDTVDIERIDTIVFTEQTSGRTITLNITYPL